MTPPDPPVRPIIPNDIALVAAADNPFAPLPQPATDADFNATPPMPIDPGGNDTTLVVVPGTVIPGEPREKQNAGHDYILALPTFRGPPLIPVGTTFNTSAVPPFDGTQPPANNAHPLPPLLVFNRAPPFPAYPT